MTLSTAMDDVITTVEALSRPSAMLPSGFYVAPYRHTPGRIDPEGAETEDGLFWFDGFTRQPLSETVTVSTRVRYDVPLAVLIRNANISMLDQMKRASEEARVISRALEAQQSWSSGVTAVITGPAQIAPTETNETDVLLVIELGIEVVEE